MRNGMVVSSGALLAMLSFSSVLQAQSLPRSTDAKDRKADQASAQAAVPGSP